MNMNVECLLAICSKQNHVYKEHPYVVRRCQNVYYPSLKNDVTFQTIIICTQNASSPSSIFIIDIVWYVQAKITFQRRTNMHPEYVCFLSCKQQLTLNHKSILFQSYFKGCQCHFLDEDPLLKRCMCSYCLCWFFFK